MYFVASLSFYVMIKANAHYVVLRIVPDEGV